MDAFKLLSSDCPAICPPVDATRLWLECSGLSNVPRKALEELFTGLDHRYHAKYLKLFLNSKRYTPHHNGSFGPREERLIEHAVHETQSLLRRLAILSVGMDPTDMHASFEHHPVYVAAASRAEALVTRFSDVEVKLTSCPRCKTVGELNTWFGTRGPATKRIPQSWCRICRVRGAYLTTPKS